VFQFDVLIIGSGLAGQSLALRLADQHSVALISKRLLEDGASSGAQGGIAAVVDPLDSVDAHIQDIIDFAELDGFMEMPLKNYSSGMVARIAFAIAMGVLWTKHVKPHEPAPAMVGLSGRGLLLILLGWFVAFLLSGDIVMAALRVAPAGSWILDTPGAPSARGAAAAPTPSAYIRVSMTASTALSPGFSNSATTFTCAEAAETDGVETNTPPGARRTSPVATSRT
jgi:hypothetical protein